MQPPRCAAGGPASSALEEARPFYIVIAVAIVLGIGVDFTPLDPIKALVWSAVLNGVIAVPIMAATMVVVSQRKIMGQFVCFALAMDGRLDRDGEHGGGCDRHVRADVALVLCSQSQYDRGIPGYSPRALMRVAARKPASSCGVAVVVSGERADDVQNAGLLVQHDICRQNFK
jgi:Mn2+/Fe2+ NRAMP family transporter